MEKLRFARSATKHRVSRSRTRHVIEHAGMRFHEPAPDAARGARVIYLGDDQHGVSLEVMAVKRAPGELLVIHSMPLRAKYLALYKEAATWRV
jgi:hypothetical protein